MFVRCNILICKFSNCSRRVKLKLFQSYCLGFYDIALWYLYSIGSLSKFRSCYNKCIKLFGYSKYDNVTNILFETGLPSFDTVCHNAKCTFRTQWLSCSNSMLFMLRACMSCWSLCFSALFSSLFFVCWVFKCFVFLHMCLFPVFVLWAILPALNKDLLIDWLLFCVILRTYSVTAGPPVLTVRLEYCVIFCHSVTSSVPSVCL